MKYDHLPTDTSIRLLQVGGATKDVSMSGSVVSAVCSIIVADLNDQPAYKCLSYTWGEPTHTGAILLDGAEFPVGQNLFGATTYLSTCPSARISPIWIDEVCINQQDLQERSQQVGMMRRIHSQAEEVLVWLGPATALDSVAIPLTKRLARVPKEDCELARRRPAGEDAYKYLGISPLTKKELDSIRHFYDRPWFERIWVIQEAVLACKLSFHVGVETMTWNDIDGATESIFQLSKEYRYTIQRHDGIMKRTKSVTVDKRHSMSLNALVMNATTIIDDLMSRRGKATAWYVFDQHLRIIGRAKKATNTRDIIYGIIGLMPDMKDFVIDYKKSEQQIFTELTRYMLHNRPGAEPKLLPRPDRSSNNLPNLPSWVPDYSVRTFFTKSNYPLLAFDKPFGNLEGGFVSTKDLYTLGIRGVKVDTIADVGESYNELKETSLICRSLALVKGLGATCSPICGSCGGRTFACTLITLFPGNAGPRVKEGFYNYLCFLKTTELRDNQSRLRLPLAAQKAHQEMAHLEQDWRPSVSEIVDCVLEFDKQKTYRSSGFVQAQAKASWYEDKLETFFDGRRFSITETGRMGIGPKSLAVGDEIWVIPRNDMVEVLRRNGPNSFVALGGAYVSDMMEGQTVSQMTDRDLIDITIV